MAFGRHPVTSYVLRHIIGLDFVCQDFFYSPKNLIWCTTKKPKTQPGLVFIVAVTLVEWKNDLLHGEDLLLTFEYKISDL